MHLQYQWYRLINNCLFFILVFTYKCTFFPCNKQQWRKSDAACRFSCICCIATADITTFLFNWFIYLAQFSKPAKLLHNCSTEQLIKASVPYACLKLPSKIWDLKKCPPSPSFAAEFFSTIVERKHKIVVARVISFDIWCLDGKFLIFLTMRRRPKRIQRKQRI